MKAETLEQLVCLLDLERLEVDLFRGRQPELSGQRVFGGQVAGQSLVAAGRTVPAERRVHSLHAYFLRPGDPAVPIVYRVDRIRDGRSFTTRRVVALQHGRAIFHLSASFQRAEEGLEHQVLMPDVTSPECTPTLRDRIEAHDPEWARHVTPAGIELRYVTEPPVLERMKTREHAARAQVWMRANGSLPDDPLLHVCLVTYASDMTLLDAVLMRHGLSYDTDKLSVASLDHAIWFHAPFRADEWFLYDQESPWAGGARGLGRGTIYSCDGRLVVSVVQEGLVRTGPRPPS